MEEYTKHPRKKKFSVSVTDDEYAIFKAYADSQERSLSGLARVSMRAEIMKRDGRKWFKRVLSMDAIFEDAEELLGIARGFNGEEYVYFIADEDADAVKIGYTKDVQKRFNGIAASNPHTLRFLFCIKGDREAEKRIHSRFASVRIRNEWFRNCEELQAFICALRKATGSIFGETSHIRTKIVMAQTVIHGEPCADQ